MKKNYIMPISEAQIIAVGQLMISSGININDDPLIGQEGNPFYGQ